MTDSGGLWYVYDDRIVFMHVIASKWLNVCTHLSTTGFPFISLVPLTTIRNGSSCTITCNVIGPSTEDLQMTWQRVDGLPLTGQVTQPSKTQLQLYIQRVTDTVHYQCIANNSLGINAVVTKVDVTSCVPSSPSITSLSCSNGTIYIAWSSAKTDSNLLTAYVVEINKATYRISPSTNSLRIHVCEDSVVSVTAENSCGRSVPAMSTFYTTTLDTSCKLLYCYLIITWFLCVLYFSQQYYYDWPTCW